MTFTKIVASGTAIAALQDNIILGCKELAFGMKLPAAPASFGILAISDVNQ